MQKDKLKEFLQALKNAGWKIPNVYWINENDFKEHYHAIDLCHKEFTFDEFPSLKFYVAFTFCEFNIFMRFTAKNKDFYGLFNSFKIPFDSNWIEQINKNDKEWIKNLIFPLALKILRREND